MDTAFEQGTLLPAVQQPSSDTNVYWQVSTLYLPASLSPFQLTGRLLLLFNQNPHRILWQRNKFAIRTKNDRFTMCNKKETTETTKD